MKTKLTKTAATTGPSRRQLLIGGAGGAVGLMLRSLATGLPVSYLASPSEASAQMASPVQTLIFATSGRGDPVNVNCPGSYVNGVENNPILDATRVRFGGSNVRSAGVWGELPRALKRRMAFFHHASRSAAHPEFRTTLSFHGSIKNDAGNGQELLPSMLSELGHDRLSTLQKEPLPLGREVITFGGQPLQSLKPSEIKSLFEGREGTVSDLRQLRDQTLDALYGELRGQSSRRQLAFVDRHVQSRDQARSLSEQLGALLERLPAAPMTQSEESQPDGAIDQVIAAVALAKLRIAPVITINIPFGKDNHNDENLEQEASETRSGVALIGKLWQELVDAGIQDEVSFAMMNVFGRNLQRNRRGGRDHNRHHSVMVAFGANIKGGVYGGLTGQGRAMAINPRTGQAVRNGGIRYEETLESAGKSLALALGHDRATIEHRINGGRFVESFTAG